VEFGDVPLDVRDPGELVFREQQAQATTVGREVERHDGDTVRDQLSDDPGTNAAARTGHQEALALTIVGSEWHGTTIARVALLEKVTADVPVSRT
jgi:hypothetical protein